jgi:hypothetical protein
MEVTVQADSTHPRDVVDAGLSILFMVDIHAFVELKDKYLEFGLKKAMRDHSHMFWRNEGFSMWQDIENRINDRLDDEFVFGQHADGPEIVGIFKRNA